MYFSLKNASPFFQRMMHQDFRELLQKYLENLGNYMDDWWIAMEDTPEGTALHRKITHEFLDQMERKSYFLKISKTKFEELQMEILGWQVGVGGICIDPSKVAGIRDWPRQLKDVKQVRSTLGALGYQRPFIKNFAAIARPLHDLTKKDKPFVWTQECTDALEQLIQAVTSEPILYQPDWSKQFKLEVDASLFAIGAVLFQRDGEGWRRPISYFSQALNPAERNYDIWDREFLAVIRGLKHNRHLLVSSPHKVLVLTNHENLAHYQHPQKINRRVARYLHTLADFDLELRHIPGSTNKADALSRRPDHDDVSQDNEEVVALPDSLFARAVAAGKKDKQILDKQKENRDIWKEWKRLYNCEEREDALYKGEALAVMGGGEAYKDLLKRYHDGMTPRCLEDVASALAGLLVAHDEGFRKRIRGGMHGLPKTKTITRRNQPLLQPITPEERLLPFTTMSVDFVVKLPESKGSDTVLTITDQGCTKAVILVPCREDMGAEAIAKLFKERVFPYTGIPTRLIFDRDTRFTSSWFKELCHVLGITQNLSMAYHPQTDGQSERTNQMMEGLLRIFCNRQANDWAEWLPVVQYIINSRPSSTTKKVPYELWMGHIPRVHQAVKDPKVPNLVERQRTLETVREEAALAMQRAQESWVRPTNYKPYQKGDKVWLEATNLHTTHPTKKLGPKRYGPFKVLEAVRHVNFRLELPVHWKIHNVFHAKLLHPYKEMMEHGENFMEPPPDLIEGVAEWEVEKILNMRTRRSQRQYLIHWKGYLNAHNSWEPWENINAPLLMAEFEKQRSAQKDGDAREQPNIQKRGRKGAISVIRLDIRPLTQINMCNRTPPTPACSITPESPFIPSPPSLMSSNSRAVHYITAAALYGQQQRRAARERAAAEEEEEVAPEDSASARVSPTNEVTNSLDALALIRDELAASEDVVMGEEVPQGFKEALQSF